MSIDTKNINDTLKMVTHENLDIRTITLGLSLRSCVNEDINKLATNVYDRLTSAAKDLVSTADQLEREFGIPIVNKRISVSPVAEICSPCKSDEYYKVAYALDKAGAEVGVDFVGGYSALVHKGMSNCDINLIESIPQALSETERVCSSVNLGSTRAGINMDAVLKVAGIIKECSQRSVGDNCIAAAKFVCFCNMVEDNPFMAGAVHGSGEPSEVINVGVSGPGVVRAVLEKLPKDAPIDLIAESIKSTTFKITRAGELIAREAASRLGYAKGILDLSLAPTPAPGDSVAQIIEAIGVEKCGLPGTTAALALLNDAVKKGGVMASSSAGGLSGAFVPVSEDSEMTNRARAGFLSIEKLEAMTSVCSVGLDMIAIPGDTSINTIAGLIADEMAIGLINNKTTAVRVIPAIGMSEGDTLNYGGLLGSAPVMKLKECSTSIFANRGGRFPAPINSLRN
ncbi:MAG: PFL family protein [Coriobacteriales bacterium]|nr:PFL family protein [Coriobacteriales bacterium]